MAKHKALFFRSGWANYGAAKPGSLRLVPAKGRQPDLGSDYAKMRPMFFGDPPPFAALIRELSELEERINGNVDGRAGP